MRVIEGPMTPYHLRRLVRSILLETTGDSHPAEELPYTTDAEESIPPAPPFLPPIPKEISPDEAQRRGANLKIWFGDSKIRRADGSPLRMYHGTNAGFTAFKVSPGGMYGPGIYFTDSLDIANNYAQSTGGYGRQESLDDPWQPTPNVMPVYLRIIRPYVIDARKNTSSFIGDIARSHGYDGIVVRAPGRPFMIVVAFSPNQVKSATGNVGDFNWRQDDIALEEDDG